MSRANKLEFLDDMDNIKAGTKKPGIMAEGNHEGLAKLYDSVKQKYGKHDYESMAHDLPLIANIENIIDEQTREESYSERDICKLVDSMQMRDLEEYEEMNFGVYVGSLIAILTDRNEKLGKPTVVEFCDNRIDYLGHYCRKFDSIRFVNNNANYLLRYAKDGNEVIVDGCTGNNILLASGWYHNTIKNILINNVSGDSCGYRIGNEGGRVENIIINNVKGNDCIFEIANKDGKIHNLLIRNVKSNNCGENAGKFGRIGNIVTNNVLGKHAFSGAMCKRMIKMSRMSNADKTYMRENGLDTAFEIIETLDGCSSKEIFEKAKEIFETLDRFKKGE